VKRLVLTSILALSVVVSGVAIASATTITLPKAGTASQITKLVKNSVSIASIPTSLNPSLMNAAADTPSNTYLEATVAGCGLVSANCQYGNKKSKKLVVLFGDSHAYMWLPGVVPEMVKLGYKLDVLWIPACGPANLTLYSVLVLGQYDTACDTWRTTTIATIKSLKPSLVLLAERTTNLMTGPTTQVTNAILATALETTITQLQSKTTKVAVIGDDPAYANNADPINCLSVNPTNVQKCDTVVKNTTPKWTDLAAGELTATKATKAGFIATVQWMCTSTTCSPIIGTMPTYFDWSHITATYSAYLSGVLGAAIKKQI
jgi:hypothetical protein